MSAFALSRTHLSIVAALVSSDRYSRTDYPTAFAALRDANAINLETRYHTDDGLRALRPLPYGDAVRLADALAPGAKLKALASTEYQSCDVDSWDRSDACRLLATAKSGIIATLPGWESGAWAISDAPEPQPIGGGR